MHAYMPDWEERERIERDEGKADKDVNSMKALTIKQPWAYAILRLGKDVENRSWRTHYRGPLLIHAAARPERNPRDILAEYLKRPPSEQSLRDLPVGCIVGVVYLSDCIRDSSPVIDRPRVGVRGRSLVREGGHACRRARQR